MTEHSVTLPGPDAISSKFNPKERREFSCCAPIAEFLTALQDRSEMVVSSPETPVETITEERRTRAASRLQNFLFAPIDIAPLVFFRITFGLLMLIEVGSYTVSGYLREHWIDPTFHFTFFGFGWVNPPPGDWLYALSGVLMLAAVSITVGFFYRTCAIIFAIGFSWMFLIEQANYLNHFYLICLLSTVAIFLPANRAFSLDCRRDPRLRVDFVPGWTVRILQAHMAIAYFYGGIAKLAEDWLQGAPVKVWFTTGVPADKIPDFLKTEPFFYFIAYSGLLIDLFMVPLLIWKRTRGIAVTIAVMFHLSNCYLFNIGVFPFLSIAMTLLFISPAWHRKILRLGPPAETRTLFSPKWVAVPILAYIAIQLVVPFRHFLYPGSVHWTEEGHRFSWHMMLRSKTGQAYFVVEDAATKKLWRIDPLEVLTRRQNRKMLGRPDMILQFAHYVRDELKPRQVAVYSVSYVSLNGFPRSLIVDPTVDLSQVERSLRPADWILPEANDRSVPGRFRLAAPASLRDLKRGEN